MKHFRVFFHIYVNAVALILLRHAVNCKCSGFLLSLLLLLLGEWSHGLPHGLGTMLLLHEGGDKYEGEFYEGKPFGLCTYYYSNGDKYFGHLKDNLQRTGPGVMQYGANGDVYEGYFKDDLQDGKGLIRYCNGDIYEGKFKLGLRHGYGILKSKDASTIIYEGYWKNDKQDPNRIVTDVDREKHNKHKNDLLQLENHHHHHHHRHSKISVPSANLEKSHQNNNEEKRVK